MRIYLVGFMGAGKTTVGLGLAQSLGVPLLDLDQQIEQRIGKTVARIFEEDGESAFRRIESSVLEASAELADAVVATGGGILAVESNQEFIRRHGTSVWLRPDLDCLLERGSHAPRSQRPLFGHEEQFRALYASRLEEYRRADLEIRVAADETPPTTVDRVLRRIQEIRCAT